MINGVIFDLDGTLLYTLEDLKDSTNYALSKFGYPTRNLEEIKNFVGNGVKLLIERAIPSGASNPDFEDCLNTFKSHYMENMYNKTKPYDGILDILKTLKLEGIQTAVVSNKFDSAVKNLCNKFFGDLIKVAIGENEQEGIRKKPSPDSVFKAISELKVSIDSVVYIGDSETDIQTAKNADIYCIGCTWGFRNKNILEKEGANYIISKPSEIIELVHKI